ncbi:enhancer of mRNA-decapping protein 4-like [Alnus glutinosa]|uniref:enhancer of mRNA-decapping protein 4-like n=1 Tax=Alnus glutinosa TaxID=3517 RepID=UPI002D7908A4|nr:enhancer of mRNA-decapping protein 4-like [Alnus glutinosa]
MAFPGNPNLQNQNQQQQGALIDVPKLFKPSPNPPPLGNLNSSPSFPTPSTIPSLSPPFPMPSSSYPPPTGPSYSFHPTFLPHPPSPLDHYQPQHPHQHQLLPASARLMALLTTQNPPSPQPHMLFSSPSSLPSSSSTSTSATSTTPSAPPPTRLLSTKLPKGRHLIGHRVLYDIDVRLQGEAQPQLEVTPITKYASDPDLVLGRQIAVNRSYICYGLKMGNIRVLNINTALRSLLRGHTQRVTDMAFFAEDVHLLASASVDGRVFIWKINEGPDEEDKPQITGKIGLAIQIEGMGESIQPRVCWHPHKQEILMVAIGNRILRIDTTKVGKGEVFLAEEPLKCHIDNLIDGVQLVGKHDRDVTELSMCQWMTSRLASASMDGMVKIWEDRKALPLAVLKPHDGHPVNSVTFLTAPHHPNHIVLITAGPLNREMKIWASAREEGWLLPSDAESWQCTQTLDIKSSSEPKIEDAFFNQVVALPRAGLFLLANAKKNAIYAIHLDYGPNPAATRMDYIAEFTVTMPILSLTGTSDNLPDGEHIVQVYCVQTQAIQQYALDLSQCLPPPLDNMESEKSDSNISRAFDASDSSATCEPPQGSKPTEMPVVNAPPIPSILSSSSEIATVVNCHVASSEATTLQEATISRVETMPGDLPSHSGAENFHTALPPLPLSRRLTRKLSSLRSPLNSYETNTPLTDHGSDQPALEYSSDRRMDSAKDNKTDVPPSGDNLWKGDKNAAQSDISMVPNPPIIFKQPTHLVTPSELLSRVCSSSENSQISQGGNVVETKVQDVVVNNDAENIEVEVKVIGEKGTSLNNEGDRQRDSHIMVAEKKEKSFYSQASDLNIQMARDCCVGTYNVERLCQTNDVSVTRAPNQPPDTCVEEVQDMMNDMPPKVGESETLMPVLQSPAPAPKGKRHKGKNSQVSGPSSPSPSPFNSIDSSNEPCSNSGAPYMETALPQLSAMQEILEQLMSTQKEIQKQMNVIVSASVTKEGKRLEGSLGRSMEKVVKANTDALWAHFLEENAKQEKLEQDHMQQITNLITNYMNKDLPAMLEKNLKKEIALVGPAVARAITPVVEKTTSSAIMESFQKGVGEKAVNQLEKVVTSKLEGAVTRQIHSQFQTSGKQALQDALRSSLEASTVPAFEMSCKAMFEQVDVTFQKGLSEHTTAVQQHFESTHSSLAIALRDTINSASAITQTLSREWAEGQRKLLAIAAASANSTAVNPLVTQLSNGPLVGLHEMAEAPLDPTKELSRLIAEQKFEEAFIGALHRRDVSIVSWLCSQVDLPRILSTVPLPLSQGVLLALLQQLAYDTGNETPRKLAWMTDVAVAINPADPTIAVHVHPIFEQVYQILGHQRNLPTTPASEASSIRLLMHVINSVLMSCK